MNAEKRNRLIYIGFAFLMAVLWEVLVWGNSLGLGFVLFVGIYLVLFLGLAYYMKHIRNKWAFLFLIPVAVLGFDILLLNNNLIHFFGPVFMLGLLILFSVLLTVRNSGLSSFALSKVPMLKNVFLLFEKSPNVIKDVFSPALTHAKNDNVKKVLKGFLIAIPVLLLFLALFMSADSIFAEWIRGAIEFDSESELIPTIVRVIIIGVVLSAFFYTMLSKKHDLLDKAVSAIKIDNIISVVVLGLVNILFLAFVFFQIKYLFGDSSYIFEYDVTFAHYARSGFFELAWVVALAGVLIAMVYWSMSHHKNSRVVNILQTILAVQVGIVAASALKRMYIYQDAYGFTILRLYVEWFIYFIMVILFFGLISILTQLKFRYFLHTGLVIGLMALTLVFSINVDYMIANKNIERVINGENGKVKLDTSYLNSLSIDVLPVFKEYKREDFKVDEALYIKKMIKLRYADLNKQEVGIFGYNFGNSNVLAIEDELNEKY